MGDTNKSLQSKLDRFLLTYRATPTQATGKSPSELLMNRQPWIRLNALRVFKENMNHQPKYKMNDAVETLGDKATEVYLQAVTSDMR